MSDLQNVSHAENAACNLRTSSPESAMNDALDFLFCPIHGVVRFLPMLLPALALLRTDFGRLCQFAERFPRGIIQFLNSFRGCV